MADGTSMTTKARFHQKVSEWFVANGRSFPWRTTKDPYAILIAEMLLRRTTATAVARVYSLFMSSFQTPQQLAQAELATVESMISSLGLQKTRARHLHKAASALVEVHDCKVPSTLKELVALPGVGFYVASAVLNFAFSNAVPLVDGNVLHLVSRVFGLEFNGSIDINAWNFMGSFNGDVDYKSFYWGIIDLVALVCLRRNPRCDTCPLSTFCNWYKSHNG